MTFEDLSGRTEAIVFPKDLDLYRDRILNISGPPSVVSILGVDISCDDILLHRDSSLSDIATR